MPTPLQAVPSAASAGPPLGGARGLPAEVLEAPVDQAEQAEQAERFVERMDEWRRAKGWSHKEFAAHLGIAESYWRALRKHDKELTIGVALRVIQERPELDVILGGAAQYFWERTRRRKQRVGGRPSPEGD